MTPRRRNTFTSLLLLGFAIVLVAEVALGLLALRTLENNAAAARQLHQHPFAVSNAAADLQSSLLLLRNQMLNLVLLQPGDASTQAQGIQETVALRASAEQALAVVRRQFLGDMAQVRQLDAELLAWDQVRAQAVQALRNNDRALAAQLVRGPGTASYNAMAQRVDYVRSFAKEKGRLLAVQAEADAFTAVRQLAAGMLVLVLVVLCTAGLVIWRVRFLHQALDHLARVDALTGLANRRQFLETMHREAARCERHGGTFGLAVLDVDHFKRVNDEHGHPQGDAVLKAIAQACASDLRDSDLMGRLGGEEFGLILAETPAAQCAAIADRLRAQVAALQLPSPAGQPALRCTVSVGLAMWRPGEDPEQGLQRADQALYAAKAAGRNRVCVAPER